MDALCGGDRDRDGGDSGSERTGRVGADRPLHGNIVASAEDNETASKLLSTASSTEHGVPTSGAPARYSWLGTQELPTELESGVVAMGARSYVPELGRFLQPDPQPGGSANAYAYTHGNPVNEEDPSGEWTLNETSGGLSAVGEGPGENLAGGVGIGAGAIMPAPVNAQIEAEFEASPPWDQATAGSEEVAGEGPEVTGSYAQAPSSGRRTGGGGGSRRFGFISYSGGGRACPPRFKECQYSRKKPSRREAERAHAQEEKVGKNAACAIAGGLTGGWAGLGVGWLCSEVL